MSEKTKEYSNGEVTIVWKPEKCIHSAKCVEGLGEVFRPKERPWINPEAASTEAIINQVKTCPSGALSFYMNADGAPKAEDSTSSSSTEVEFEKEWPTPISRKCKNQNSGWNYDH